MVSVFLTNYTLKTKENPDIPFEGRSEEKVWMRRGVKRGGLGFCQLTLYLGFMTPFSTTADFYVSYEEFFRACPEYGGLAPSMSQVDDDSFVINYGIGVGFARVSSGGGPFCRFRITHDRSTFRWTHVSQSVRRRKILQEKGVASGARWASEPRQ
jgi:hypothetical protein